MPPTTMAPGVEGTKYRLPKLAPDGQSVTVDLSGVPAERRVEVVNAITTIIAVAWATADEQLIADAWAASAEVDSGMLTPLTDVVGRLRAGRT